MDLSSDDEPIIKRRRTLPMATAQRYDAIARHRAQFSAPGADKEPVPEPTERADLAHLKRQSMYTAAPNADAKGTTEHQFLSDQTTNQTTPSGQLPEPTPANAVHEPTDVDAPTRPQVAPSLAYPNVSQCFKPVPVSLVPFHDMSDQQHKDDLAQRRNEQIQATRFINSLRRAVDHNVRSRDSLPTPNMHNLPNYAYNQTTKELARLHQQDDYVITRPESSIHDSHTHLRDHIEHHVFEFQRHRIQVLQENAKRIIYLNPDQGPS